MDAAFLLRGIVIGFSIAAPVGPIGVLCIRRTLADGFAYGVAAGLGAASADALYGSIAGFGLSAISNLVIQQQTWLRLIGGLFLCYLGVRAFVAQPASTSNVTGRGGAAGVYASTCFLTLSNPMTILAFAAIFAGLGVVGSGREIAAAGTLVLGIFVGSALWWLTLSGAVGMLRTRFTARWMRWVNRASGVIIAGFGLAALAGGIG
jgi:threonine/homoserine/homoserine lactone efflux protein